MPANPRSRTRAALVAGALVAASTVLAAGPASAEQMSSTVADTMTFGQVLLVFLGIPLTVAAVIYLLVAAPGWTRSGRVDGSDAWTGDPLVVGGAPDSPAAIEPSGPSADPDETGGTSARW